MVYQWKTYERSVSAQLAGEHIEELDREHGEVTPQILLDDARPEDALLHPLYEWRDDVAAEKYRLQQSGKILQDLVCIRVDTPVEMPEIPVRAFVSVEPQNRKGSYRPIVIAMSDEQTREQVFANARAELAAMENKYKSLISFSDLLREYLEGMTS